MIAETEAYKRLVADEELNKLFDQFSKKFLVANKVSLLMISLKTYKLKTKRTCSVW